jgi:hypothetical protein
VGERLAGARLLFCFVALTSGGDKAKTNKMEIQKSTTEHFFIEISFSVQTKLKYCSGPNSDRANDLIEQNRPVA